MPERAVSRGQRNLNPGHLGVQVIVDMNENIMGRDRQQGGEEYEGPIYVGSFHV